MSFLWEGQTDWLRLLVPCRSHAPSSSVPFSRFHFLSPQPKLVHVSFSHQQVHVAISTVWRTILPAFGGGGLCLSHAWFAEWGNPKPWEHFPQPSITLWSRWDTVPVHTGRTYSFLGSWCILLQQLGSREPGTPPLGQVGITHSALCSPPREVVGVLQAPAWLWPSLLNSQEIQWLETVTNFLFQENNFFRLMQEGHSNGEC